MEQRVHIIVAEPSLIVRSGVIAVLKKISNIDITESCDILTLVPQIDKCQPDILLINPSCVGIYLLQQIRSKVEMSNLKIIALQHNLLDNTLLEQYDEVISIYSSSNTIKETLMGAIHIEKVNHKKELSIREREIVICIVKGLTNKQIANQLFLSTHTIMTHRRNITNKLQIHSSSGLTIYAIVNKLVELNDIKSTISSEK